MPSSDDALRSLMSYEDEEEEALPGVETRERRDERTRVLLQ